MDARRTACLAALQKIAEDRGGKCLATEYKNNREPLFFECNNGHTWAARPFNVTRNHWCMACHQTAITIDQCQQMALARGGLCLSEAYINNATKLLWQCSYQHQWEATMHDIKDNGRWCPACSKFFSVGEEIVRAACEEAFPGKQFCSTRNVPWMNGLELDVYNEEVLPKPLALERQGIQHYKNIPHFHRTEGKFEAQQERDALKRVYCAENNCNLIEVPYDVKDKDIRTFVRTEIAKLGYIIAAAIGTDTEFYDRVRTAGPQHEKQFARALEIIHRRNGICLSLQYLGSMVPLALQCKEGHRFESSLNALDHDYWCGKCAGNKRQTEDEIRAQIERCGFKYHGIKTVKTEKSSRRHVQVECSAGHVYWVALHIFSVKNGTTPKYGCKQCFLKK